MGKGCECKDYENYAKKKKTYKREYDWIEIDKPGNAQHALERKGREDTTGVRRKARRRR